MKIKYSELTYLGAILDGFINHISNKKESKSKLTNSEELLLLAIPEIKQAVEDEILKFNRKTKRIDIEFASKDKDNRLLTDKLGRFIFTPENLNERDEKIYALEDETLELGVNLSNEEIENLPLEYKLALNKFIN